MKNRAEEMKMKKGLSFSSQQLQSKTESLTGPIVAKSPNVNEDFSSSFSESSETESQRDVGVRGDFVGFKKTRDFGDFVTFSNSPSQL